ncbi:MAG: CARDB domain-containing protein [Candidatus Thorarchaeota archaeon]|jgi:uncharacterized repeat protein (TIGR01451 family)
MKFQYRHAFAIILVTFLAFAPAVAASSNQAGFVIAQDIDPGQLIENLLTDGAEVLLTNIDEQGVPAVIYGQLGIPSGALAFDNPMYDGCIAMVLAATHGEIINMILELIGASGFMGGGDDGGGGFLPAQFGGDAFSLDTIFDMIGTEFNLLVNVFVNVAETASVTQMTSIKAHLASTFGFSFTELIHIRVDESTFPPDLNFQLPFDSVDVFVNQEMNVFADALSAILGVMNPEGIAADVDQTVFTSEDSVAAAAGLLAIPDMAELIDLISSFGFGGGDGGDIFPLADVGFAPAQFPFNVSGPIAVAAAGYLGEQLISATSTSLSIGSLIGATGTIGPLDAGLSIVLAHMPEFVNITSYEPYDGPTNHSFFIDDMNMLFWNSTAFGDVADYVINFEESPFPPLITIDRTFVPDSHELTVGGTTTVTVTVTNEGDEAISNVTLTDNGVGGIYDSITVSGTQSQSFSSIAAGASETISYTVTFSNEGSYTFPKATAEYVYDGRTFTKESKVKGFVVEPDMVGIITQLFNDGMPYSLGVVGIVALAGLISIRGILKI